MAQYSLLMFSQPGLFPTKVGDAVLKENKKYAKSVATGLSTTATATAVCHEEQPEWPVFVTSSYWRIPYGPEEAVFNMDMESPGKSHMLLNI